MLWLIRPTASESRAPYSTRDSTSRPWASVPSRNAGEGGSRLRASAPRTGSAGASQGASSAASTIRATIARPARAQRSRARRYQTSGACMGASTTLPGTSSSRQADALRPGTPFTLILGGGGMKGVAHVGVLQALIERGLAPSHIIGSRVGSLIGAPLAAGHRLPELRERATGARAPDRVRPAPSDRALKAR